LEAKTWEVELKFHLDDPMDLENRLADFGFVPGFLQLHEDLYFRHPCRDFKSSDEALRLRKVDSCGLITYKGPRQTGPVKMREEIELPLDASTFSQWHTLLTRLGFQPLPAVKKSRREFKSDRIEDSGLAVVIDCVEELGNFVEIETLISDDQQLPAAQAEVLALAKKLGLQTIQPRSYLDQLLELRGS